MKVLLIAIIGVLIWQSNDARHFIADSLENTADFIRPNTKLTISF
ncbi:hypothetical protein [Synechococcus phage S-H38]|uniref:Uncharacterized protein n=1 Tax=Synechococcus phage S-H38 TaxID=2783673 RepID=A0A873WA38_9CAUD|nr:hypothetical protein PQC14_gp111 [Synechococcus phage S-H38]QPB07950.1 hypothetical protein [Synechococcus phage S-H38]